MNEKRRNYVERDKKIMKEIIINEKRKKVLWINRRK